MPSTPPQIYHPGNTSANLTPASVNATGLINGSNVTGSGVNTGDQDLSGLQPKAVTADLTGQTAAVSSVVAVTAPSGTHQYLVGGYVNITAILVDVLQLQCAYTDENNASQTVIFFPMGLTAAGLATVSAFSFPSTTIRVKGGTTITIKTALTTSGGTIAYDVGGNIQQLN